MKAFVDYAAKESGSIASGDVKRTVSRGPRDPSLRLRFRVLLRDNFRCRHCGRSPATYIGLSLHVDHVRSWEQGGPTTYENLQTLCADCNLGKSNLSVETEAPNQTIQSTAGRSDA
jgi:5-methylcytosine-specific restriction endonuclease McrA